MFGFQIGLASTLKFLLASSNMVAVVITAVVVALLCVPCLPLLMFQRINRSDPEQVFLVVRNVAGATITANYPAVWDTGTFDGVRVTKPATATLSLLAGVANADIVDSAYGVMQAYGYRASAFITNDTSVAVAAGDILIPVNAQWYLARSAASDGKSGFIYAGQSFATATTPAAANKNVFIRAL